MKSATRQTSRWGYNTRVIMFSAIPALAVLAQATEGKSLDSVEWVPAASKILSACFASALAFKSTYSADHREKEATDASSQ